MTVIDLQIWLCYPAALAILRLGVQLAKSARNGSLHAFTWPANRHPAVASVLKLVEVRPVAKVPAIVAVAAKIGWCVLKQLPHALSFYVPKTVVPTRQEGFNPLRPLAPATPRSAA